MLRDFLDVLMQPLAIFGLLGQACFFSRFLVQWVASEREKRSVIPVAFWYLSLGGGILVLIYAVCRRDPIFTLGQSVGIFVYTRNLLLVRRAKAKDADSDPAAPICQDA